MDIARTGARESGSVLPHELAVSEASAAFTALTGIEADTESTPIIKTVSGSLYAQVREQMTIGVTVEGSTPEEIRQNVIAQLRQMNRVRLRFLLK